MGGSLRVEIADRVARVTLARPEKHNAFDDVLIGDLTDALNRLAVDPAVRVVALTGEGKSFSAGADLDWMRRAAAYGSDENLTDARSLATLMRTLDELPKPTLAVVNGAAIGGGVGLVACCDVALAADTAVFALSEVRLGLVPAVIAPYVVRAMGARQARRYFLTAERFGAEEALAMGLAHVVTAAGALETRAAEIVAHMLQAGPEALADAKRLVATVQALAPDLGEETARLIAARRASEEGREGVAAFLDKRPPRWR